MKIRLITRTNLLAILAVLILSVSNVSAQAAPAKDLILENGVAPHKGLDEVYRRFSEGYRKLDAASVANLYTETAAYLAPLSPVKIGRAKVLETFTGFFDTVKRSNGRAEISFRILQRQVDKNLAYDVGTYTLTTFNEKGEPRRDTGKFIVVAKRENSNVWRFQVDGYNALPRERTAVNANPNASNNAAQNVSPQSQTEAKPDKNALDQVRKEFELIFAKQVADYKAQFEAVKRGEKLKPTCAPDFKLTRPNGTTVTCEQITAERQARFERIKTINYLKIEIGDIEIKGNEAVIYTTQRFSRVVPDENGKDRTIVTDGTIHKEFWTKTEKGWESKGFEEFKQGTVTVDGQNP